MSGSVEGSSGKKGRKGKRKIFSDYGAPVLLLTLLLFGIVGAPRLETFY